MTQRGECIMASTALNIFGGIVLTCVLVILASAALQVIQWAATNAWALAFRALNAVMIFMDVAARRVAQETKAALLLMFRLTCWTVRLALSEITRPLWSRVAPQVHAVRERLKRWIAGLDRASREPQVAKREEPRAERARKEAPRPSRGNLEEAFKLTMQTIEKAKKRR